MPLDLDDEAKQRALMTLLELLDGADAERLAPQPDLAAPDLSALEEPAAEGLALEEDAGLGLEEDEETKKKANPFARG
jgi:hypothetical protein